MIIPKQLFSLDEYTGSVEDRTFNALRNLSYTGSLEDMLFSYLRDAGLTGSIEDMLYYVDEDIFTVRLTPQTGTQLGKANTLIKSLKSSGVWDKLDVLVYLAHDTEANSLINIKQNLYNPTNQGMTFAANEGFTGNGTDAYIQTNFTPVTTTKYQLNSAHLMMWSNTDGQSGNRDAGGVFGEQLLLSILRSAGDSFQFRINDATTTGVANTDATGMFVANRPSSSVKQAFRNGVQLGTDAAVASTNIPDIGSRTFRIGGFEGSTYSSRQFRAYSIGGGLTAQQISDFFDALTEYAS